MAGTLVVERSGASGRNRQRLARARNTLWRERTNALHEERLPQHSGVVEREHAGNRHAVFGA
jgi:hypothetical protein